MRTVGVVLAACLLSCNGDLPIPIPIPTPDLPCPPFCPSEPGDVYDCSNPPSLTGQVVPVRNPVLGKYIVKLKPQVRGFQSPFLQGVRQFQSVGMMAVELNTAQVLDILADPAVDYVQQVGRKFITTQQWNLDRIDDREGLDGSYQPEGDGAGVHVAVVDTGITEHEDFAGRLSEDCFTAHTFGGCRDMHGHGTHVSGTIAGRTFGVAAKATLYAVRVLDDRGYGEDTDVIRGIDWVIQQKHSAGGDWVLNMSLGGPPAPALDDATCRAIEAGVTVVVAAGNEGGDAREGSPARVLQALTIGAMEEGDSLPYFTNFGPVVDLFAPGALVRSARPGGGSQLMDGTSMASPHVAGAAALYLGEHSQATPGQVSEAILADATPDALSNVPSETSNLLLYVGPER